MLLPCFQESPSQCNIDCPVIYSNSMCNSIWLQYGSRYIQCDCFRFVGRHLELLVMFHHCQCWGMLLVVSRHQNCKNRMRIRCLVTLWFSKSTKNVDLVFVFPAALLDFRCNIGQQFFMAICSPAISRKSHQTVSLYSKRFGNAVEKIGLG